MAVINQGILGGFKGKVANVIGTSWKGKAVMKSRPLSVANPKSSGQVSQRNKFSSIVALGSSLLGYTITPIWNKLASQMSGFNMFIQMNSQTAFTNLGVFVPAGLHISPSSTGSQTLLSTVADRSASSIDMSWSLNDLPANALGTDKVYMVAIDNKGTVVGFDTNNATRGDEQAQCSPYRALVVGELISCYLYFASADGKRVFGQSLVTTAVVA